MSYTKPTRPRSIAWIAPPSPFAPAADLDRPQPGAPMVGGTTLVGFQSPVRGLFSLAEQGEQAGADRCRSERSEKKTHPTHLGTTGGGLSVIFTERIRPRVGTDKSKSTCTVRTDDRMKPTPCYPIGPSVRVIHRSVGRAFMISATAIWRKNSDKILTCAFWSPGGQIVVRFWSRPHIEPSRLRRLLALCRARPLALVSAEMSFPVRPPT